MDPTSKEYPVLGFEDGESEKLLPEGSSSRELPEVDAINLQYYKCTHDDMGEDLKSCIDDCIIELSKIQSENRQLILTNMELTIQPSLNRPASIQFFAGGRQNRVLAYRPGGRDTPMKFLWYNRVGLDRKRSRIAKWWPYILFTLVLLAAVFIPLDMFLLHDVQPRIQAEGIMTLRNVIVDGHHDPLNQYYKLPNEDADMNEFSYQGD